MEPLRIQKFISDCGIMSRRAAEEAIVRGEITVNGEAAEIGMKIDPESDVVEVKGKIVKPRGSRRYEYLMLNKPRGYVTTMSDDRNRPCVADLVKEVGTRVYPVGRLDYDSEGLLILTDDGALANKMMHPSGHVPKVYHVKTDSEIDASTIKALSKPFDLDGYITKPAECAIVKQNPKSTVISVTIGEGRNRQIRRMFESLDLNVVYLRRVAIGQIKLGNLKPGEWKRLSGAQISYLKKYK